MLFRGRNYKTKGPKSAIFLGTTLIVNRQIPYLVRASSSSRKERYLSNGFDYSSGV